jgi:hypothetical protein
LFQCRVELRFGESRVTAKAQLFTARLLPVDLVSSSVSLIYRFEQMFERGEPFGVDSR